MDEIEWTAGDQDGDNDPTHRSSRYVDFVRKMDDLRNDEVIVEAKKAETRYRILAETRQNRLSPNPPKEWGLRVF